MENKRVLLGMSGGVDSSVAAHLLKERGYEVVGVTMKLWSDSNEIDTPTKDARKVCEKLGIEFHEVDFKKEFKEKVIDNFIDEYFKGHTPNPCVYCNKNIKFDDLFKKADELNCKYVATGHYALIGHNEETGKYELRKAKNDKKDQTYVLYNLNQEKLSRIIFPIGEYEKDKIREIAQDIGLEVHNKPESQDICFIPDGDYEKFIKENSDRQIFKGSFVDGDGNVLGSHNGIINYTIGQRKGLGITFGKPTYVVGIDGNENTITLGDNEDLYTDSLIAKDVNFTIFDIKELKEDLRVEAKIRYSASPSKAIVTKIDDNRVQVKFDIPQRAITKGQSVVFYKGEVLLGGGIIE